VQLVYLKKFFQREWNDREEVLSGNFLADGSLGYLTFSLHKPV
jgi:hypothetical protein